MKTCPFLNSSCIEHQCVFYVQLIGKDPQTGADINTWGCSFAFLPSLLIETTQAIRQANSTVQEFRNEANKHNEAVGTSMAALSFLMEQSDGPRKLPDKT